MKFAKNEVLKKEVGRKNEVQQENHHWAFPFVLSLVGPSHDALCDRIHGSASCKWRDGRISDRRKLAKINTEM